MWAAISAAARRVKAVGPGGGDVGEEEEEGVAGAAGEGGEGGAEGGVVAEELVAVVWDARVEPAAPLEEEEADGAAGGRRGQGSDVGAEARVARGRATGWCLLCLRAHRERSNPLAKRSVCVCVE